MNQLSEDLQRMIKALETLSEQPGASSAPLDDLLDQLFQQKIDLAGAQLNTASPAYQQAANDLAAASAKAERTIKNPAAAAALIPSIEQAISRVDRLLNDAAPSR